MRPLTRRAATAALGVLALAAVPVASAHPDAAPPRTPASGAARQILPPGPWRPGSFRVAGASPIQLATRSANGSTAYVAWIDQARTQLALYPGSQEPPAASPRGPAEVPPGQRGRLLATFNGGFKAASNAGGFLVNGRVDLPLRAGLATLVEYRDGRVAILDWGGRTPAHALVLARQNLYPLVWAGRPSRSAAASGLWGRTLGGGTAVWRSALGITARGDLVYAAADGQTPASLAALMVSVGAVRALELDINPEWPSFIAYGAPGGRSPFKLVPNTQQTAGRYLRPDTRDFFAVYTRAGGGPYVPFR